MDDNPELKYIWIQVKVEQRGRLMRTWNCQAINSPGHFYAYSLDAALFPGINYYRLKMFVTRMDVRPTTCSVVDIRLTDSPVVAPNPATANTTIFFDSHYQKAGLSVYDAKAEGLPTPVCRRTRNWNEIRCPRPSKRPVCAEHQDQWTKL